MDLWQNDDELLLMELERRDGIYSFIFHELEANKTQTDLKENQNKRKQTVIESEELVKLNAEQLNSKRQTVIDTSTASTAKSASIYPASSTPAKPCSYGDALGKSSTTDFSKMWQQNFNFQFPMTSAYPSLQQFCSLSTFSMRRPKSPFSHIQTPLVRNRRHELKETKEYKNFMQNITKVADLRELFPLDPDVHAPFAKETNKAKNPIGQTALQETKLLK